MKRYLDGVSDEILEELVYEYEEVEEIDVDKIISNLKNNISNYIFDDLDNYGVEEPELDIDFDFENEEEMPIELIEKIEPKDEFVDK